MKRDLLRKQFIYLFIIISILSMACNRTNDTEPRAVDLNSAEDIMIFPATHPLNTDISNESIDVNSDAILQNIGLSRGLFPDFGSGEWEGVPIGIPYTVVGI